MKNLKQTGNRPEDSIAASCHNLIILDESGSMHPFVYDTKPLPPFTAPNIPTHTRANL